eukprot:11738003-Alexandrium_andersonii.AAC.1
MLGATRPLQVPPEACIAAPGFPGGTHAVAQTSAPSSPEPQQRHGRGARRSNARRGLALLFDGHGAPPVSPTQMWFNDRKPENWIPDAGVRALSPQMSR